MCPYFSDVHIEGYTVNAVIIILQSSISIEQDESQLTTATDTKQLLSS